MKVHELAKELEVSAKDLLVQIKKLGIEAKSNFADLDPKDVAKIKSARKEPAKEAPAAKAGATAKPRPVVSLVDTTAKEQLAGARKVRKRVVQAAHEETEETESREETSPAPQEAGSGAVGAPKSKIKVISRAERKPATDAPPEAASSQDRNAPDQTVRPARHQIKVISRATPAESAAAAQAVLPMTEAIRQLIMKQSNAEEIRKQAVIEGMTTMLEDGLKKVLAGSTTIDEVLRATRS